MRKNLTILSVALIVITIFGCGGTEQSATRTISAAEATVEAGYVLLTPTEFGDNFITGIKNGAGSLVLGTSTQSPDLAIVYEINGKKYVDNSATEPLKLSIGDSIVWYELARDQESGSFAKNGKILHLLVKNQ